MFECFTFWTLNVMQFSLWTKFVFLKVIAFCVSSESDNEWELLLKFSQFSNEQFQSLYISLASGSWTMSLLETKSKSFNCSPKAYRTWIYQFTLTIILWSISTMKSVKTLWVCGNSWKVMEVEFCVCCLCFFYSTGPDLTRPEHKNFGWNFFLSNLTWNNFYIIGQVEN